MNRYNVKKGCLHNSFSNTKTFTAIYPKISILNHSCDASIKNLFDDDCLKIIATKDIGAGQQIYNCYGARFDELATVGRNEILAQQYYFKCKCTKCQQPVCEKCFNFFVINIVRLNVIYQTADYYHPQNYCFFSTKLKPKCFILFKLTNNEKYTSVFTILFVTTIVYGIFTYR